MLWGERIGLRPVQTSDFALMEAWNNDAQAHGEYNMFGLRGSQGFLDDRQGSLMVVELGGEVVGSVSYHAARAGEGRFHARGRVAPGPVARGAVARPGGVSKLRAEE